MMFVQHEGFCIICDAHTIFESQHAWLRDHYICTRCGSIPRERAMFAVLDMTRPEWRGARIHESSPSAGFLRTQCPNYSHSFYFPDTQPGVMRDGGRCENLEALTFDEGEFEIFITQDVMEHVFHPEQALSEISRVLADGGMHVFTTPKHRDLLASRQRARLDDAEVVHICTPPQYHGNPLSTEGSLVTWDYGSDFEELAARWSGYLTSTYVLKNRRLGLDGEFLDVFVTNKRSVDLVVPAELGQKVK